MWPLQSELWFEQGLAFRAGAFCGEGARRIKAALCGVGGQDLWGALQVGQERAFWTGTPLLSIRLPSGIRAACGKAAQLGSMGERMDRRATARV